MRRRSFVNGALVVATSGTACSIDELEEVPSRGRFVDTAVVIDELETVQ